VIIIMVMVAIIIIVPVGISRILRWTKRVLGIMAAILASLHLWLRELECTYAGELIIYLGLFDPDALRHSSEVSQ
jgi:hypothetical protein